MEDRVTGTPSRWLEFWKSEFGSEESVVVKIQRGRRGRRRDGQITVTDEQKWLSEVRPEAGLGLLAVFGGPAV